MEPARFFAALRMTVPILIVNVHLVTCLWQATRRLLYICNSIILAARDRRLDDVYACWTSACSCMLLLCWATSARSVDAVQDRGRDGAGVSSSCGVSRLVRHSAGDARRWKGRP